MILLGVTVLALLSQFILLLAVFMKDRRSLNNLAFFLLSMSLLFWAFLSYFYEAFPEAAQNITVVRLTMFFVVLQNTFFVLFTHSLKSKRIHFTRKTKLYIGLSIMTAVLALTPALFMKLEVGPRGYYPLAGPGMLFFIVHAAISVTKGFRNLIYTLRHSRGVNKRQIQYIFFGSLVLWALVPLTNFVFSVTLKTTFFGKFSPIYGFVFSSLIAYAIVRHKLFDIKRTVARSVVYILSLGFIGLIYGVMIFILSIFLTSDARFDNTDRAAYVLLALISAVLFNPVKRFFDRLTNRIFYRDAYDSEAFLDELNSAIVGNIELGILLRHSTNIIQKNLKCEHCFIEVQPTPTTPSRIIGVGSISLSGEESAYIIHRLEKSGKKIIVTDHLGTDENKLKNILSGKDIGIIVNLVPSDIKSEESIARLIIGAKKSGNVYDRQDVHTIDIISDELLIAIENALRFEEIQGFAAKLQAEVNTATTKLQRTNKKLRDLDETKDEFISMASHQLRTPLTSVKGYMSMVLEEDAGKITKQQRELLNQAFVSAQRMVYLIADLLNVSRLKTGKFVIEATPTNLAEVISGEIDQLKETAKAKNIEITYDKPKDFPTLNLDETKVRQVIMNFADNAIYYTPRGGKVKVELSEDKSNVYFKVIDNGLGVPKADIPHLFTKFYRASNARKARPDGTGLGLFMAKKVIDSQGGNLLFESEENKGSMFGFCFDKKKHKVKAHAL